MTILLRTDSGGRVADERLEVGSGNDHLDRALLECLATRVVFTPRRSGGIPVISWQRLHWKLGDR
jgi:hypothetical protein